MIALALGADASASADEICSLGRVFMFAGAKTVTDGNAQPVDGVRAVIDNKLVDVCDGVNDPPIVLPADGDASVWVMLASGATPYEYAQVGYGANNPVTYAFVQYNDGTCDSLDAPECSDSSHFLHRVFSSSAYFDPGTSKAYKVRYVDDPSHPDVEMFAAGTRLQETPWDPTQVWSSSTWLGQIMGEAHDPGDDLPGTPSSKTLIDGIKVRHGVGTGWQDAVAGTLVTTHPYYSDDPGIVGGPTCTTWCFRIWTDRTQPPPVT